jgi:hypothetical protein
MGQHNQPKDQHAHFLAVSLGRVFGACIALDNLKCNALGWIHLQVTRAL